MPVEVMDCVLWTSRVATNAKDVDSPSAYKLACAEKVR